MTGRTLVVVLAGVCLLLISCSKGDGVCTPGATQQCACPGGSQGAQTCAADGSKWESCACSSSGSPAATSAAAVTLQPATVVPVAGNGTAPVRNQPGFEGTNVVQQLKAGTRVSIGEKRITPTRAGKSSPDTWFDVRLANQPTSLGWMHADVLLWAGADAPKVACSRCGQGDSLCTEGCKPDACRRAADCESGEVCCVENGKSSCVRPVRAGTVLCEGFEACTTNADCGAGNVCEPAGAFSKCVMKACKTFRDCTAGHFCLTTPDGASRCAQRHKEGEACSTASQDPVDCLEGLKCVSKFFGGNECQKKQ